MYYQLKNSHFSSSTLLFPKYEYVRKQTRLNIIYKQRKYTAFPFFIIYHPLIYIKSVSKTKRNEKLAGKHHVVSNRKIYILWSHSHHIRLHSTYVLCMHTLHCIPCWQSFFDAYMHSWMKNSKVKIGPIFLFSNHKRRRESCWQRLVLTMPHIPSQLKVEEWRMKVKKAGWWVKNAAVPIQQNGKAKLWLWMPKHYFIGGLGCWIKHDLECSHGYYGFPFFAPIYIRNSSFIRNQKLLCAHSGKYV